MGNKLSKAEKELARNDSLLSQDGNKEDAAAPPAVKRKALADQGLKKFKSLAELGNGPRGRKGAPELHTSAPRKASVDGQTSITEPAKVQRNYHLHQMERRTPQYPPGRNKPTKAFPQIHELMAQHHPCTCEAKAPPVLVS
jgi:hypothetical protein